MQKIQHDAGANYNSSHLLVSDSRRRDTGDSHVDDKCYVTEECKSQESDH